jgi:DNA-binding GntR family transcriptional regulator
VNRRFDSVPELGERSREDRELRVAKAAVELQTNALVLTIKFDIIFGRLRPRQRLIEDELALRFGVSRHLVRAAIVELEQLGIVVRRPNKGAMVRDYTVREIDEMYDMRAQLQAEAARRMPLPPPPEFIEELRAIHKAYCEAGDKGDLRSVCTNNSLFHRRIWANCGSAYLAYLVERVWTETLGIRCYGIADPKLLSQARDEHAEMIEMIASGDREGLVRLSVDHIWPALNAYKRSHGSWDVPQNEAIAEGFLKDDAFI